MSENEAIVIIEFLCPLGRGTTVENCKDFGCSELYSCLNLLQKHEEVVKYRLKTGKMPIWIEKWMNKLRDLS